jgi:hypothetical protein
MPERKPENQAESAPSQTLSRREFALRAALASAATTLAPSAVLPAAIRPGNLADALTSLQAPPGTPSLSAEGLAEADARLQIILARYGNRLSQEQKADLVRLARLLQPQLESLRAYPLNNGDAPALYLKPLVEREKQRARDKIPAPTRKH